MRVQKAHFKLHTEEVDEYSDDDSDCNDDATPEPPQYSVNTEPADDMCIDLDGNGLFFCKCALFPCAACRVLTFDMPCQGALGTISLSWSQLFTGMHPAGALSPLRHKQETGRALLYDYALISEQICLCMCGHPQVASTHIHIWAHLCQQDGPAHQWIRQDLNARHLGPWSTNLNRPALHRNEQVTSHGEKNDKRDLKQEFCFTCGGADGHERIQRYIDTAL